jgi:hypothetical protein
LSAEVYTKAIERQLSSVGRNVVELTIIGKSEPRLEKTYNLDVIGTSTYLVNGGVVVHNCDLISMLIVSASITTPAVGATLTVDKTSDSYDPFWDDDGISNNRISLNAGYV